MSSPPRGSTPTTMSSIVRSSLPPPTISLLIYPCTLILGSIFSVISPTAAGFHAFETDMNPSAAPPPPPNYFARKNNVFNVYFVKVGWLWTTLAFVSLLLVQYVLVKPVAQRSRRVGQAIARYSLATLVWYLTTQWFFGPAIIDRGFVITGGKCNVSVARQQYQHDHEGGHGPIRELEHLFTAAACKAAGGSWSGGHDVSGHVFMLVLATAMLSFEMWGVYASEEKEKATDGSAKGGNGSSSALRVWPARFVWGVVGLSWWMLFMTAIWFHTWLEKWSGLSIALGTVYVIYILPRTASAWREIIGIPGF
ncbi:hypothetical protein ASPZODRAFT_131164 [Penicilliopsis zonata CBS 506.65]|uniref:Acyl-coenzyme A diphosphatase SCS3 n=1 Tax=Penicilliopsis zonata CBS 506.65 TaxID=1073090 RepID=A0A1L9SKJ6_9EURO|nr:hypothetical protein ASPZODRAFT_131164 [Penicilliopsis zonata CBS 506.65]OJJ47621.1 hypothetical protein ASPZODRAFT_131164 [Penicilliopsis zonata CBS 506.65]